MKTPFKFNISTVLALVMLFAFGVMLSGRNMSEEKSELGYTTVLSSNAVTYVKDGDFSVETSKDCRRFFRDTSESFRRTMENSDIMLLSFPDDQEDVMELSVRGKEDVTSLADMTMYLLENPTDQAYSSIDETSSESIELNGRGYEKTKYALKSVLYAEYQFGVIYATTINDKAVFINCYTTGKDINAYEKKIQYVESRYSNTIQTLREGDATKAIKSKNSDGPWTRFTSFTFSLWVLLIPVIYIAICGMKVVDKNYVPSAEEYRHYEFFQPEPLGLRNSKNVLGLFAVLIVYHHLAQKVGSANAGALNVLEDFGVGLVSMFFFFSGYGLLKSMQMKKEYLKGFFKKRYTTVLVPFYMAIVIFVVRYLIDGGNNRSPKETILYLSGLKLINTHMWYIIEILIFYAAFYLIYRFVKKRRACLWLMFLFIVGFVAFSMSRGHGESWFQGEWWYNTSLIFWIGMVVAMHEGAILGFMKKHYNVILPMLIVGFVMLVFATKYMLEHHGYWTETATDMAYRDKLMTFAVQFAMCVVFVFLMVAIFLKVRIENAALTFLGNISLELYLVHNLFLQMFERVKGVGMYAVFVVIASVAAAAALHWVDMRLICKIMGKKIHKREKDQEQAALRKQKRQQYIQHGIKYVKQHPDRFVRMILRTGVCVFLCIVSIGPIYMLYINSTRTRLSISRGVSLLPEGHFQENIGQFKDYADNLTSSLGKSLLLSCFIAVCATALAVYFGCACAYGFEIFDFAGKKVLWKCVIATMMMPPVGSVLGFYHLVSKLGLVNTIWPLIIPSVATPATAYFMRMYFQTVRLKDIVEAARIDGCSEFGIYNHIILPSVKPALSLQIIFTFVNVWNNSFYQGLILQTPEKRTISSFLKNFAGNPGAGNDPVMYAILLLAILPPVIIYILFSKSIVSRIVIGAVKE